MHIEKALRFTANRVLQSEVPTTQEGKKMKDIMLMSQKLKEKRGDKGFTLMEMLIVVAIIAILVAIAIPVFTSQLNNAKEATDEANGRALYALASTTYMTNQADYTAPTVSGSSGSFSVTYQGTQFKFTDKCTALAVDTNATTTGPTVTLTSNTHDYSWGTAA